MDGNLYTFARPVKRGGVNRLGDRNRALLILYLGGRANSRKEDMELVVKEKKTFPIPPFMQMPFDGFEPEITNGFGSYAVEML
ncbi:hypothetical protein VTN00DRAFT_5949 [Thermoascus crustaceus]|uniref:uncharacterized protein n=1 Tax=Thermoascus crustaceus TaxID=5088 RepID=UPI003743EE65